MEPPAKKFKKDTDDIITDFNFINPNFCIKLYKEEIDDLTNSNHHNILIEYTNTINNCISYRGFKLDRENIIKHRLDREKYKTTFY